MRRIALPNNRKVRAGLGIVAFFALVAAFGPVVVTHVLHQSASAVNQAEQLQAPSGRHLLGTTQTGEDVLAQLMVGTRTSLLIGLVAGTIATVLGVVLGVTSAYVGGKLDALLTVFTNVFLVLPGLPLLIIVASYLKGRGGWFLVALIIGLTGWAGAARVKRAQALSLRRREFVTAAEMAGERPMRIIVSELVPHLAPLISSTFVFSVVGGIFAEAGLDFIGAGNVNSVSWGTMLYWSQAEGALTTGAWWWFIPPGACIALVGFAAGLINFGIDEISDPRHRAVVRRKRRRIIRPVRRIESVEVGS